MVSDVSFSNVPAIRAIYRQRVLSHERAVLAKWATLQVNALVSLVEFYAQFFQMSKVDKYERSDFMNPNELSNYARLSISAGYQGTSRAVRPVRHC